MTEARLLGSAIASELPTVLRDEPLLLLEPHLDDAVLSCWALLSRSAPLDVLAVLVGTPVPPRRGSWDRVTGFTSSADSIPARIEEERAALAGTPHTLMLGKLLEGQYLDGDTGRQSPATLIAEIHRWLDRTGTGVVVAPAGAGRRRSRIDALLHRLVAPRVLPPQHPDHLFVRDAAVTALADRPDARLVLYEEFPYRWGAPADVESARVARALGYRAELVVVHVEREAKADRIRCYASQVAHLRVGERRVDAAEDLPDDERYWLLRP